MLGIAGRWKLVAAAAAAALVISACGSSKSTSTPSTSSPSTSSRTTGSGGSPASSPATGTPYKLMWTESSSQGGDKYVAAIEKGVNARGGIAGHPLQIVVCVDNNDANQATQCARQAVEDPNMLGIIANSSTCSSELLPILAKAQMASIDDQFVCPESFKSPQVFPFSAGSLAAAAGTALGVKYFKDPNVVIAIVDVPAGREFPPLVQSIVGPVGGKVVNTVYIPLTSADVGPYAAQVAAHPGPLTEGLSVTTGVRLGKALQSIGYNQPIIYNSTEWYAADIKSSFGNPTNAYITQYYNERSPGWKMLLSDLNQYEPGVTYTGEDLVNAWLGANVVAQIAKTLPTVSAKAIFSYLSTSTNLTTFGMTTPLNFTVPQKGFGGLIPRAAYAYVALYHYVNGSVVQVTPFEDLLPK